MTPNMQKLMRALPANGDFLPRAPWNCSSQTILALEELKLVKIRPDRGFWRSYTQWRIQLTPEGVKWISDHPKI